jgi:hypothetical protein
MTTLTITDARNKALIGKIISYNELTNECTIGKSKKVFSIELSIHQPFKSEGNYKVVKCTLEDMQMIRLFDLSNPNSAGINIYKYTIN